MKRRRRRGGANGGRALNATKVFTPESTGLALKTAEQLLSQEEGREETCMDCHFSRREDHDEVKGLRRCRNWKTRKGAKRGTDPHIKFPSKVNRHPRNSRFSNIENMMLVSKLVQVYEQLMGKGKSRTSLLQRSQMWQEICDAVNAVGNKQRFIHQCKKRFNDIKRQLKNKLGREKSLLGDHAGPFQAYYTQYEEELKKVLPTEVIDGIEFFDSDHPQELCSGEEAGPSWCMRQNRQKLLMSEKSSQELQDVSEPEALQRPMYMGFLDEQWSMLPDIGSTLPVESNTVRCMNFSTDHIDLQSGHPVDPGKPQHHDSRYSIKQPSSLNVPHLTPHYGAHLLKVLKTTQKLFQKSMMHSLNVLHLDVGHFNKCIAESNSIADNLLTVESERNNILHEMNIQLGKLAEGVEQLADQQQAENVLLHDFPRRHNPSPAPYTSISGGVRTGASHQAREGHPSFGITSSAMTCLSPPGFMLGTGQ